MEYESINHYNDETEDRQANMHKLQTSKNKKGCEDNSKSSNYDSKMWVLKEQEMKKMMQKLIEEKAEMAQAIETKDKELQDKILAMEKEKDQQMEAQRAMMSEEADAKLANERQKSINEKINAIKLKEAMIEDLTS